MPRNYPAIATPERYLTALGDHDPIESLRKAPKRVRKAVKGLSEKHLARRVEDGKWSIKEVLAHLADHEVMFGSRIRLVAAMERPALVGYDQDAFVDRLALDDVDAARVLADFTALRAINVALLARLGDDVLGRIGVHSERGEESLATMVFQCAGHDRLHEEQLERLRGLLERSRSRRAKAKRRKKSDAKRAASAGKKGAEPAEEALRARGKSGKKHREKKASRKEQREGAEQRVELSAPAPAPTNEGGGRAPSEAPLNARSKELAPAR